MICAHGEQKVPRGESGTYFICQFGTNKNRQCRWAKWCKNERLYETVTDDNGKLCDDFMLKENNPIVIEEKEIKKEDQIIIKESVINIEKIIQDELNRASFIDLKNSYAKRL